MSNSLVAAIIIGTQYITTVATIYITKCAIQVWNKNCSKGDWKISDANIERVSLLAGVIIGMIGGRIASSICLKSMEEPDNRIYILGKKFGEVTPQLFNKYANVPTEHLKKHLETELLDKIPT